jgi:hypothetical protein
MSRLPGRNTLSYVFYLLLALGLLTACTATMVAQDPPTPTPEVFIPRTAVVPQGATISGSALWGSAPVANARLELRTGAWADPTAGETIAQSVADGEGHYVLEAPPAGGEFGLVATWPDGSTNTAPVTPVQVPASVTRIQADAYLAKEIAWLEPIPSAEVSATPTLRWDGVPGVSQYRVWVIDAGTTELAFDLTTTADPESEQAVILPPLAPGRTYTWDVQGLGADGNMLARRTGEFRVAPRTAMPTPEPTAAQIIPLDETWSQYTDHRLGFSIQVPHMMVSPYGSCKWVEENGSHSYQPEPSYVPVKVFEDGDTTYIAGEYYYELTGETKETSADGTTRTFFSECQVVTNSLELLRNPENHYQTKWEIVVREVRDDDELDAFIKSRYGSGCSLGERIVSGQDGVYDVRIQGDGKGLSETRCPLNYATVVKYYPAGDKVIAWNLGQGPTFVADVAYPVTYDREMVDSFRFLIGPSGEASGQTLPERCDVWGHDTYIDRANGFCFAYPPRFEMEVNEAGNPVVYGSALDSSVEPLRASLLIEVQVAAEGKTLGGIVDGYLAQFATLQTPAIVRTPFELGGRPAEMLEVVPGREGSRDLFMLRDGTLFHLMFMPSVHDFPQAKADVELLFNTVVNSFALMAPDTGGPDQPMPPVSNNLTYTAPNRNGRGHRTNRAHCAWASGGSICSRLRRPRLSCCPSRRRSSTAKRSP